MISCDKPRAGANTQLRADFRMGKPVGSDPDTMLGMERTRGTETSHYPQEKKVKNDCASSGERTRKSPNHVCQGTAWGCRTVNKGERQR